MRVCMASPRTGLTGQAALGAHPVRTEPPPRGGSPWEPGLHGRGGPRPGAGEDPPSRMGRTRSRQFPGETAAPGLSLAARNSQSKRVPGPSGLAVSPSEGARDVR